MMEVAFKTEKLDFFILVSERSLYEYGNMKQKVWKQKNWDGVVNES